MRKIKNAIWIINSLLFVAVVAMGIEQAGKGAELASLENSLLNLTENRQKLSDVIFTNDRDLNNNDYLASKGYIKPTRVYYFNTEESFANLPVR